MAAPQPNTTLVFTLSTLASTALSSGLTNRHGAIITNNDLQNSVAVGFGTNNAATVNMHVIPPGGVFAIGDSTNSALGGGTTGSLPATITSDIAAIAVSGAPIVAFTEW